MDIYKTQAQLFKVLMHPTRLAILDELRGGEQCVCHYGGYVWLTPGVYFPASHGAA